MRLHSFEPINVATPQMGVSKATRQIETSTVYEASYEDQVGSRRRCVAHPGRTPKSGIDRFAKATFNTSMRSIHPVTSQPLTFASRSAAVRRMPAPSRLPTVVPTCPTPMQRVLRLLGLA
jgi:hypothetical protein